MRASGKEMVYRRAPLILVLSFAVSLCAHSQPAGPASTDRAPENTETQTSAPPTPSPENANEERAITSAAEAANREWISGRLELRADAAWSESDTDLDFDQWLHLNLDPPGHPNLRLRGSFWLREDLDSNGDRRGFLRDIDDTYDSDIQGRIVQLYLEVDDLWGDSVFRLGRQRIIEGVAFNRIDGLFFKQQHAAWNWYVFGGLRASLYDEDFDEPALGGGVSWNATPHTRLAIDAYWAEEDRDEDEEFHRPRLANLLYRDYPRPEDYEFDDGAVALSLWQDITANLRLHGRLTINDAQGDELFLQTVAYIEALKLSIDLSFRRLFDVIEDRGSEVSRYYRILGPQEEFDDWRLVLYRPIGTKFAVTVEAQRRDVHPRYKSEIHTYWDRDYDYAYTANLDFNRYAVTLTADELLPGVDAMLAWDTRDVDGPESSWSVTGEVSKTWERIRVALNGHYARYENEYTQYDFWPKWKNDVRRALASFGSTRFSTIYYDNNFVVHLKDVVPVHEREDIYSIGLRTEWKVRDNQEVTLGISYEEDDGAESPYWRAQAGYELRF